MSGWKTAKETAESHKGGGIFARLENDKDKFVGVFCGEPHTRELYYDEKSGKYETFTEEHKKANKKSQPKFSLNVYIPSEDAMKVTEVSIVTFKDILKSMDKYGTTTVKGREIFNAALEVERQGKKGDKKTSYSVLFEAISPASPMVDDAMREKIMGHELHDLAKVVEKADDSDASTDMNSHKKEEKKADAPPKEEKKADAPAPAAAAPAAMASDDITVIAQRLKAGPAENVPKFLSRFGIQKIKELKAADRDAAFAFVDELEGKTAAKPVDPFADD